MSSSSQKTVLAAVSVLAVLAVLQLTVAFAIFLRRSALIAPVRLISTPLLITATPVPTVLPAATPVATPLPPVAGAKTEPTPAARPLPTATVTPDASARETLVQRCRDARGKGDMTGALAGLREAQRLYPDDPLIVSELAITYEQMGLVDKALAQWKRVFDAGEKAGDLYGIASEKLKNGVQPATEAVGRDADGMQPGSTMGFADVQKSYAETPEGTAQMALKLAIKSRPLATISPGDVSVQVAFYDLVNNTEVEQTDAKVSSNWITAPADWQQDGMEVLQVNYQQKPKSTADVTVKAEDRKYLGYIVRVYYKNELQDVRAEPVKLLQYFPPPVTLQTQTEIPQ